MGLWRGRAAPNSRFHFQGQSPRMGCRGRCPSGVRLNCSGMFPEEMGYRGGVGVDVEGEGRSRKKLLSGSPRLDRTPRRFQGRIRGWELGDAKERGVTSPAASRDESKDGIWGMERERERGGGTRLGMWRERTEREREERRRAEERERREGERREEREREKGERERKKIQEGC
ncbi:hypothetical protein IWX90DRAFT_431012 [Phyllosticta citrichinensis]|uniref:Uncharacterized protein n=1 Tax=Phyllosticta citrichinensis TaxID=1130410 RepID=A0ABR1XX33_9PEZI